MEAVEGTRKTKLLNVELVQDTKEQMGGGSAIKKWKMKAIGVVLCGVRLKVKKRITQGSEQWDISGLGGEEEDEDV